MAKRGRVVVLHFVAQMPMAGIAWQALQYLVGLEQLGFEAWYVENHGANPYDPRISSVVTACDYNVAYLKATLERFGLGERWAYWDAINDVYHGLSRERVFALLKGADALINLCGSTRLRDEHMQCPVRIMVDTDPVYEQIKYANADPAARAYLDAHTHFFTYGENVGGPGWIVPLCGIPWKPTRPPVVLDLWPEADGEPECFSTIATWENKGKDIEFQGQSYVWSKHVNFMRFLDLPQRSKQCFMMAMLPPSADIESLVSSQGWKLVDPRPISATLEHYSDFIRRSRGEFTVAKDIYVRPKSGWFSDRSVCYLASGRPVVTMATDFSRFYPVGEGLFDYTDTAGAMAAIAAVGADYRRHARAARRLAAEFFASDRVVGAMMDEAGASCAWRMLGTMTATELRPASARTDGIVLHLPRPSWDGMAFLLFLITTVLVLVTFQDYGVTWDEDVHTWYGIFVLDYYVSGFTDLRSLHWLDLFNYGAVFDTVAAALNKVSPFGTYESRHLLNGVVGIIGLVGTWKLGRALGGPRVGFFAALFLALTPNYYGQMFNNPKDIPFAAGAVWAIYYLVLLLPELPRPRPTLVLRLGLACGLTLGVRVGGLLLLAYVAVLLGLYVLWRGVETRQIKVALTEAALCFWHALLPVAMIAYPVMLVFWPWAQQSPLEHPLAALATFSHETFPFRTLFAGAYFPASDLPWIYLPVHILLALPELILLLLVAAPFVAIAALWRDLGRWSRSVVISRFVIAFAILFPVAYAVAIKAVLFDGMRHFIFVLPLIAAASALVIDRVLDRLTAPRLRRAAIGALVTYGLVQVAIMASLHPDEYVYYNAFIGGTEGAQGLFKLDYWANSYAEAVHGLREHLKAEYGSDFADHDFTVAVCGPPGSAAYYFPPNFIYTDDRENADFFIAFTKDDCDKSLPGTEIYRVERLGTLLSLVLDRRDIVAGTRPALLAGGR